MAKKQQKKEIESKQPEIESKQPKKQPKLKKYIGG